MEWTPPPKPEDFGNIDHSPESFGGGEPKKPLGTTFNSMKRKLATRLITTI